MSDGPAASTNDTPATGNPDKPEGTVEESTFANVKAKEVVEPVTPATPAAPETPANVAVEEPQVGISNASPTPQVVVKNDPVAPVVTDPPAPAAADGGVAVAGDEELKKKKEEPAKLDTSAAETEEQRLAREKAEAEKSTPTTTTAPAPLQPKATTPAQPTADQVEAEQLSLDISRFRDKFANLGYLKLAQELGAFKTFDDTLAEAIGDGGKIEQNRKYGLDIILQTGHKIELHQNLGGAEFIGMTGNTKKFDQNDAKATVAAAISKGWSTVKVHGSEKQKSMLWLEAKLRNLEVTGYEPNENDKKLLNDEMAKRGSKYLAGMTEDGKPDPYVPERGYDFSDKPAEKAKGTEEKAKGPEADANAGKAAPATPEKVTPPAGEEKAPPAAADGSKPVAPPASEMKAPEGGDGSTPAAPERPKTGSLSSFVDTEAKKAENLDTPEKRASMDALAVANGGKPATEAAASALTTEQLLQRAIERSEDPSVKKGLEQIKGELADGKIKDPSAIEQSLAAADKSLDSKGFNSLAESLLKGPGNEAAKIDSIKPANATIIVNTKPKVTAPVR